MVACCKSIPGVMIGLCKMLNADFLGALIGVWHDGCASRTTVTGDVADFLKLGSWLISLKLHCERPTAGIESYGWRERHDGSWNLSPSTSVSVTTIRSNTFDQPQSRGLYPLSEAERLPCTSAIPPRSSTQLINAMIDKWRLPGTLSSPLLQRRRSAAAVSCQT